VRVAVVDVGANTLRLLVAESTERGLRSVREERRRTLLGEDVERLGRLTDEKIERSAEAARKEVRRARKLGAGRIEIVVTSPWRNAANGRELVSALGDATGLPVRALSADEEAELGFIGAVSMSPVKGQPVAVCDVGGGSAQIAIGSSKRPSWLRSIELGSLRLTNRCLHSDPPTRDELSAARLEVEAAVSSLTPPLPAVALATGGTARALRRIGLDHFDADGLERALARLVKLPASERARRAGADLQRARTLPAGALILIGLQQLLRVPIDVADGGVREGACLGLLEPQAATG
jgi:exopolyphosphatase / guanosine-5'-triphosphate,3'-diphosphate pyrophosphatase